MLRDLRKNISYQIQIKQIRKQKLFDEISKIDSDLLELNEIFYEYETGTINGREAAEKLKISASTFYRRYQEYRNKQKSSNMIS